MTRAPIFDVHVESATRWLEELRGNLDLPPTEQARALHALRAGLHAIRDRLPAGEVVDLAAQLPVLIRGMFYEGWRLANDPRQLRTRAEMVARVQKELARDPRLDATDVLRAVIHLLVEHVSDGEIRDLVSTLPKPIAALWQDLTGHVLDPIAEGI